jgi:DnaA family protein
MTKHAILRKIGPMSQTTQLTLPLDAPHLLGFDSFFAGENRFSVEALQHWPWAWPFIFLQGPSGSGKSHLGQAVAEQVLSQGAQVAFLQAATLQQIMEPAALDFADLIILDDFDSLFPAPAALEENLFHLYNHVIAQGIALLIISAKKPDALPLQLQDLKSRLNSGLQLSLKATTGDAIGHILSHHAKRLNLTLTPEIHTYLLHHGPRDPTRLIAQLERISALSLKDKRRLTLPYVRQILT